MSRVVPDIQHLLQPIEDAIRTYVLPHLTPQERRLIALPARLGGLGITNPVEQSQAEHEASLQVTAPLIDAILHGYLEYSYQIQSDQMTAKSNVKSSRKLLARERAARITRITTESTKNCSGERLINMAHSSTNQ